MITALGYIASYGYIVLVFIISFIFQKMKLVGEEGGRKIIHIMVCITWLIMEKVFAIGSIHKIIIPLSFVMVNWISMKKHIIPGMDRKENDSYGTVFYALSLTIMNAVAVFDNQFTIPAGFSIFVLSFGDGFAAILGRVANKNNIKLKEGKSLYGTIACILFSVIGIEIVNYAMGANISFALILMISMIATALEFFSGKYDNLAMPIGTFLITYMVIK